MIQDLCAKMTMFFEVPILTSCLNENDPGTSLDVAEKFNDYSPIRHLLKRDTLTY